MIVINNNITISSLNIDFRATSQVHHRWQQDDTQNFKFPEISPRHTFNSAFNRKVTDDSELLKSPQFEVDDTGIRYKDQEPKESLREYMKRKIRET